MNKKRVNQKKNKTKLCAANKRFPRTDQTSRHEEPNYSACIKCTQDVDDRRLTYIQPSHFKDAMMRK